MHVALVPCRQWKTKISLFSSSSSLILQWSTVFSRVDKALNTDTQDCIWRRGGGGGERDRVKYACMGCYSNVHQNNNSLTNKCIIFIHVLEAGRG